MNQCERRIYVKFWGYIQCPNPAMNLNLPRQVCKKHLDEIIQMAKKRQTS